MRDRLLRTLSSLEHRAARALLSLPRPVQRRLAGGPVVRDGKELHPELALLLTLRRLRPTAALSAGTAQQARRRFRRELLQHAGEPIPVGAVRDLTLDVGRPLPARHYAPAGASDGEPLLLFLHGGGFAVGDLDTHDPVCRMFARHARVHVLAVDYRLAPEHPYPAAVEDARAALRWAARHAASLGADPARLAVGGDSAGGNLSAVVAKHAASDDDVALAAQLLLYPAIDRSLVRPSLERFAEGFLLSRADVEIFHRWYVPEEHLDAAGHAPLKGRPLSGLPPALVVTAGFDPLRDEGDAYAAALRDAGTPVVHRCHDGFPHGFVNLVGLSAACRDAVVEIARELRALLDRAHDGRTTATAPIGRERAAAHSRGDA